MVIPMNDVKRNKNKKDNNIELPKLKNQNKKELPKLKEEYKNKEKVLKSKKEINNELPKLKKDTKNKNEKYNYTITVDDIVKLVEDHEIKKDSNIKKEDLNFVKKENILKDNKITQEEKNELKDIAKENSNKEIKQAVKKEKDNNNNNTKKLKKKKLNKGKLISLIILIIMIPILAFSTYKIINYLIETPKTKDLIKEINDTTEVKEYESDEAEIIKSDEKPNTPYWNFIKMKLIDVDFNLLKETNSDTVAWLFVGGTNVNYPVVQTSDNDFYLNHSFDKKKNSGGWLFMDYRNDKNDYGRNTII